MPLWILSRQLDARGRVRSVCSLVGVTGWALDFPHRKGGCGNTAAGTFAPLDRFTLPSYITPPLFHAVIQFVPILRRAWRLEAVFHTAGFARQRTAILGGLPCSTPQRPFVHPVSPCHGIISGSAPDPYRMRDPSCTFGRFVTFSLPSTRRDMVDQVDDLWLRRSGGQHLRACWFVDLGMVGWASGLDSCCRTQGLDGRVLRLSFT